MPEAYTQNNHYIVAGDPHAPHILLHALSESPEPAIRTRVAENPATAVSTLVTLLADEHPDVRIGLTYNPSLPVSFLHDLANDPHPDVRYAVAESPHVPKPILVCLWSDENPYVANRAQRTLERIANSTEVWQPLNQHFNAAA